MLLRKGTYSKSENQNTCRERMYLVMKDAYSSYCDQRWVFLMGMQAERLHLEKAPTAMMNR